MNETKSKSLNDIINDIVESGELTIRYVNNENKNVFINKEDRFAQHDILITYDTRTVAGSKDKVKILVAPDGLTNIESEVLVNTDNLYIVRKEREIIELLKFTLANKELMLNVYTSEDDYGYTETRAMKIR